MSSYRCNRLKGWELYEEDINAGKLSDAYGLRSKEYYMTKRLARKWIISLIRDGSFQKDMTAVAGYHCVVDANLKESY